MAGRINTTRTVGFTLVELLITLLVVSVLLSLAAPPFLNLLERNRLETTAARFFSTLMTARSEALKRNQPVVTCKSVNGTSCVNAGNWEGGWMTYADEDADSVKDAAEPVLVVHEALSNGDTLRVTGADFANEVIYHTDGTVSGSGVFILCNADKDTALAREIAIAVTGRPQRRRTTADCTP